MVSLIAGHGFGGAGLLQAFFLGLIALGVGHFVCAGSKKASNEECGKCCGKCGKVIGGLIMILALLALVCTGYQSFKQARYHHDGKMCHEHYGDQAPDSGAIKETP